MHKKIGILVIVLLVASWFWYVVRQWIDAPGISWNQYHDWLWPILLLTLLVAVKSIAYLLLSDSRWRWGVLAAAALPFFFFFGFKLIYTAGVAAILLFNFFAMESIRDEAKARVRISAMPMLKRGIPALVTSLLLATSFAYYESPAVQASVQSKALPPFIRETVSTTARQFLSGQLQGVSPAQRTAAENQVVAETMSLINNLVRPYRQFIPPALALGMFLILQGLSFIFVWLAAFIGWALFMVLRKTNVVKIEKTNIEAERIVL
ncbi:MAG: hypothetical protein AAB864_00320 [Patescibacteria group bacterium]